MKAASFSGARRPGLEHPDRLENTTFVFGAETALHDEDYPRLAMAYSDQNQMFASIVQALKSGPATS